jgi:AraC-like DNA-binding protein
MRRPALPGRCADHTLNGRTLDERSSLVCNPSWGRALTAAQRQSDLERLRRVRDRIDREYAQPLNVEALARGVNMPAGHLSRQFRLAYGASPYTYLMTRRIERATALRNGRCGGDAAVWRHR